MGIAEILKECRARRRGADLSEQRFLIALVALETCTEKWESFGTFSKFLDTNDLAKPSRYEAFKRALERIALEDVERIGVPAAKAAGCITDDSLRSAVLTEMRLTAERNEVPLSAQNAEYILRRHGIRGATKVPSDQVTALKQKCILLQARIDELEHENAQLRERLGAVDSLGRSKRPLSSVRRSSSAKSSQARA
jgi:hypothetical protein